MYASCILWSERVCLSDLIEGVTKSMKKLILLLLAVAMLLSMTACGGENADVAASETATGETAAVSAKEDKETKDKKSSAEYETFKDLPVEWDVYSDFLYWNDDVDGELYLRCGVPEDFRLESSIYGFFLECADYGGIIVSAGEYTPGLTVDDAFESMYRDYFLATLDDYEDNHDWMDFTPDTTERLTINGRDAIHFTGVQNADDYGTAYNYLVYGYCVVIENIPVIIAAVAGDPELEYQERTWATDDMELTKHYADEMICSLRAIDHYEEYGWA